MQKKNLDDLRKACVLYISRKQSFETNGFWGTTDGENGLPLYVYKEPNIKAVTRELMSLGLVDWWYYEIDVHDCDTFLTIEVKNGIHPIYVYVIPTDAFYDEFNEYIVKTHLDTIFDIDTNYDTKTIHQWATTDAFRCLERWYGVEFEDFSRIDLYPLDVTETTGLDVLPCIYPRYTYDEVQRSRTPLFDIFNDGYFKLDGHWDSLTTIIAESGDVGFGDLTDEDVAFVVDTIGKDQWEPTPQQHHSH